MPSTLRRALREVVGLYWDSGLADDVPALAWFLLSSLAPLALGITALAAVLIGDYAQAQSLAAKVADVLPKDAHDQIVELILRTQKDSPLLITGAILGMVWTSAGAVGVIGRCLRRMLARDSGGIVIGKLRNLGVAAGLALVIVLAVIAASAGTGLAGRLDVNQTLIRVVVPVLVIAMSTFTCAAMYRVLALGAIGWPAALAGGAMAGLMLQVTPIAAGYYMRWVAGNTPVKAFLILAGVLFTCYVVAVGLLIGSGVTVRLQLGRRLE
jgi:uncharacterized BrkB/YihY/UPF0761 family membrane protein